ncbi:protein ugt; protein cbr ugt-62; cre ugt-63 prote in; cbn ugt-64 protein [Trichuris trichiura]|uniref:UDP-glucuronosyltransferase n=1 Tax=Trichuris trichiura TaxID=36087 RepID=A0A077Z8K7_TRITR|nr:protein ugt; protein cbr ugt-62; cre ugt-63 prote in; cbn ugt-64 protein [Trichuris trichiura]
MDCIITIAIALFILQIVEAKKILFMPAMAAPSHIKSILPLARALRKDGHNISVVQYYADESEKMFDYDIDFIYVFTYGDNAVNQKMENLIWRQKMANPWELLQSGLTAGMAFNTFMVDYACPKASKLSNDYLQFIEDNSSKGTVVFSFGHFGNWKIAPTQVVEAFSSAFEDLPQYHLNMVTNKSHVKIEAWVPLPAILQHPKTVLFITHSGIKSFREAVCFAVPVVTVPLFVDQLRHAVLSVIHGFGVRLDKTKLSKQTVHNAITTVAENNKYKQRITKFSAMVSDTIIDDTEKGRFWINFHRRHPNSVEHMRLKGLKLNCFSFNCYDALTLLCALFFVSHYVFDC